MKNYLKIYIISAIGALLLTGCYEDKGNYDYSTEGGALDFSEMLNYGNYGSYTFRMDEEVTFEVKYKILDPTLNENNISYTWFRGSELISTEKALNLGEQLPGDYKLMLVVTDNRFNYTYSIPITYTVTPMYTDGWAVLSDNNGTSELGYFYIDASDNSFSEFEADLYPKYNNGETLGTEPKELVYHAYGVNSDFALNITQGGTEGPIDLDAGSMTKLGTIKNDFIGEAPANLNVKSPIYKNGGVFILTEDGDVYLRDEAQYNGTIVPHTGKFPSVPAYIDGGMKISKWINNSALSSMMLDQYFVVGYDEMHDRLITFIASSSNTGAILPFTAALYTNANEPHLPGDPGSDGINDYPDIQYPGPEDLSGYDVVALCSYNGSFDDGSQMYVANILKKESDNTCYLLTFGYWYTSRASDVDLEHFYPFPVEIDPDHMIYTSNQAGEPYMYFTANGNKDLYFLNLSNGTCRKIYSSASEITALRTGEASNMMYSWGFGALGRYGEKLVVGTVDGQLTVLEVTNTTLAAGNATVLKQYDTGAGKIVAIEYMSNDWLQV